MWHCSRSRYCAILALALSRSAVEAPTPLRWAHVVFINAAGDAYTSGHNDFGQLGLGDQVERASPSLALSGVRAVAWGLQLHFLLVLDWHG
mmetsp:Transcript_144551/g.463187  ORF Transcript_144551/g.463187 Transcript_144551/m.463187 type:complete len:91 (+) Transcript_144551:92-364(+)